MVMSIKNAAHLFVIVVNLLSVDAFNLETRLPVVKRGNNGSYFGYAVAAHQPVPNSQGIILVGAPLDQNLQPNTTRSGALWKCKLTYSETDCTQVITDGRRVEENLYRNSSSKSLEVESNRLYPPGKDEDKNDQWLGVTVKSQGPGGKVLVCAHRYRQIKSFDNSTSNATIYGLGLCYVLTPQLEFHSALNHCYGKDKSNGHVGYGFCQIGTSGMIFEDDSALIGAPGPLTWRGAIFVSSVSDDFLQRDKLVYEGVETRLGKSEESESPDASIKKVAYMGMSVTAGYFLGDNITVYVAGAPRNRETGQVILFTKPQHIHHPSKEGRLLREQLIIGGEQIASNFGYEVIGADVNGDKLPDLIVAAPFYFTNEAGGAVYVYMNDHKKRFKNAVPVKLTGKPESRFGFALTNLGDLNKDGFEDIAVGAPYENKGVVYIYLGSRKGLITKPSQIIRAETDALKDIPLSTFGYSLSGGIDLDENGYPDLVVGAYESDTVVLLRSRPIIGIRTFVRSQTNLSNFDPNARNCLIKNTTTYAPCFHFETCCIIDSIVKNQNHLVQIEYELHAETFNKQRETSRIWFDDFTTKNHIIVKNLTLFSNSSNRGNEFCSNHTAYLKENTQDIQSPIQMRLTYRLVNQSPLKNNSRGELLSLDNYPILNQQEADKIFQASFLKDCGNNDECESELVVATSLSLKSSGKNGEYDLILGEEEKLFMNVNVTNIGESAYQAQLFIYLPERISYSKSTDLISMKEDVCSFLEKDRLVVCRMGNPMKQNEQLVLQLEIDLQNVDESLPELIFKVLANTTSDDKRKNETHFSLVNVIDKTMIHIFGDSSPEELPELVNGEVKSESVIEYKEETGPRVTHSYTVVNNGSWHASDIEIEIEWPYQVASEKEQGKWLLYLDEKPELEVSGNSKGYCLAFSYVNPLNLRDRGKIDDKSTSTLPVSTLLAGDKDISMGKPNSSSNAISNRLKRDFQAAVVPEIETYTDKAGNKRRVVNIDCLLGTAKCHRLSCRFDYIEKKQFIKIKIRSRLWEATLIEDYANVDEVKIRSRAKIHIPETNVRLKNWYSNEDAVETKAKVTLHGQQPAAPIPLFIIIVAIIIGLLLFMLLTLLLWKLGFFKRRRPDPTLSGNLEKHRIDDSYHDY